MELLTEHDVLHKKFQGARFRQEGYNQDDVDDFLDVVADTIRVLTAENEKLRKDLAAGGGNPEMLASLQQEIEELRAENASYAQSAGESDSEQSQSLKARIAELEAQLATTNDSLKTAYADLEATRAAHAASNDGDPAQATGMLQLAQRLHDEYVSNGKAEGEQIVARATREGERIVKEAEDQHARTIAALEEAKAALEGKIEELRVFESDYRTRITEHLQELLSSVTQG